ncbi:MAG: PAS domain S-box protein, partial [Mariprofundaceae bacterium]
LQQEYALSGIEAGLSVIGAFLLWRGSTAGLPIKTIANLFTLLCTAFFSYLFISGGADETGIYWLFIFPFAAFFLKGVHFGLLWVVAFFLLNALLVLTASYTGIPLVYSDEVIQRAALVYIFAGAFAYLYESLHFKHQFHIRQKEGAFRELIEHSSDIVAIVDPVGEILFVSPSFERTVGYSTEEVVGRDAFEFIHSDEKVNVRNKLLKVLLHPGNIEHAEFRFLKKDGTWSVLEAVGQTIVDENSAITVAINARDITERKEMEEALFESQQEIQSIFESLQDTFYRADIDGNITMLSPSVSELMNCQPEELLGKCLADYYVEKDGRDKFLAELQKNDGQLRGYEAAVKRPDGSIIWLSTNAHYCRNREGAVTGVEGTIRDITDKKRQEEELRKLSRAVEQANDAILITNKRGIIEYVNPFFTTLTGYSPDEAIGQTPGMLEERAKGMTFYKEFWRAVRNEESWSASVTGRRKDGSIYPAHLSVAPIHNESGEITHYVGIQQDMSEHKKLEEQLAQAQKMEAVGIIAGGVAHDFNNMLAGILGNTYLLKRSVNNNPKSIERIESIETLSNRAAKIVASLLAFSQKETVIMDSFPLHQFMEESRRVSELMLPEQIEFNQKICPARVVAHGSKTHLQQVIINLLDNACDALSTTEKPTIFCNLSLVSSIEKLKEQFPKLKGRNFARLSITDNGCGIPKDTINHIFEPFYTTKEVGKGTGLGLSMVFGTIESHGGAIEVESEVDKGTAFHIYIPVKHES